jgi:hypothetical protein
MGPDVRRDDGLKANILKTVIPTKVGTHTEHALARDRNFPAVTALHAIYTLFPLFLPRWFPRGMFHNVSYTSTAVTGPTK